MHACLTNLDSFKQGNLLKMSFTEGQSSIIHCLRCRAVSSNNDDMLATDHFCDV